MTVNGTNNDLGSILNTVEKRLGRLERQGRGFSIPPPVDPVTTISSDTPPAPPLATGTLWFDTDDGSKIYRWNGSAWVPTMDPTVDIARNQASVAIASWQDDVATADGLVTLYRQAAAPGGSPAVGDLWVDSDNDQLYRWNGTAWADQSDTTLGTVLDHPALTSTVADGRVRTWWQFNPPTPEGFGDIWAKTSDSPPTLWRWNNFDWVQVLDWSVYVQQLEINTQQAVLDTKVSTYVAPTAPTPQAIGDVWFDTDNDNRQSRWDGTAWVSVRDATIVTALATANSKNAVYRQDTAPWAAGTTGHSNGDLWYETDAGNKPWVWDAINLIWVDASDPKLDLLEDIGGLVVDPLTGQTLHDITSSLVNLAETAHSARNLASTADGRVSMSDYDPVSEDVSYYATDRLGNLILGSSWTITSRALTAGIATLEVGSGFIMLVGELFVVVGVGAPFDGTWRVETYTPAADPIPASVTFRITGQADVATAAAPTTAKGYNTLLMQRVEGSVWFTRTRARLNYVTNPSFEIDTTGWAGSAAAITRIAGVGPGDVISGGWLARVTNTSAAGDHRAEWTGGTPGMAVVPGRTFSVTCFALLDATTPAPTTDGIGCYASVRFYDASSVFLSEVNGPATTLTTGTDWRELKVTATAPTGAAFMSAVVLHNPNASAVWLIDGALVEQAGYTGRYFDGESYDAMWTGTEQASTSQMAGGKIISVYELYNNGWVRLDFTATTAYDQDAGDLLTGTLPEDRIGDRSISVDKLRTNEVRASEPLLAGDLVNVWSNNGLFFVQRASAGLVNLLTNPGFAVNTTGWTASLGTLTRVADATSPDGDGFVGNMVNDASTSLSHRIDSGAIPVNAGSAYTFSAYLKGVSGLMTNHFLYLIWLDAASAIIDFAITPATTINTSDWTRMSVTGTAPVGTATVVVRVATSNTNANEVFRMDALQLDESATLLPYRGTEAMMREAHGFVLESAEAGDSVPVFTVGYNPLVSGQSPGPIWLAVAPGKVVGRVPAAPQRIVQQVGFASDATTMHFTPQLPIRVI